MKNLFLKGMPVLLIRFHTPQEAVGKSCKEKLQHLPYECATRSAQTKRKPQA
jgi:hypothetical protein